MNADEKQIFADKKTNLRKSAKNQKATPFIYTYSQYASKPLYFCPCLIATSIPFFPFRLNEG
jgi:hypothetical protein